MMMMRTIQVAALGAFVALFGLTGPSFAQKVEPKLDLRKLPTKLKPGALPAPGKLPKLNAKSPLGRRGKLDPKTLRKSRVGKAKPAPGAKNAKVGTAPKPFARKGGRTPPPGVEDKSNEKPLPAWQRPKEGQEEKDDKPTLSADFIKNCARIKPGVKVHLDIYDEELEAVVKLIACMTGKNIILAKPLKGKKITIYSPTLVTANEAYRAFLTALEANGFTISKQGRFLRIINIKDYAKHPDPFLAADRMPAMEDRMVTQIISLENVDAQEMNEVITKLATPHAQIIVYQPTNSLIMTELSSNLRKIKGLLKELDVPGGQETLWTYQVLHADSAEIASKIQELFESEGSGKKPSKKRTSKTKRGSKKGRKSATTSSVGESELDARVSKIVSDERTNRLFIVATARSYRRVKALIHKLDIAVEGDGQVHIHQLNHAKAQDLSGVLSNLSQEQRSRGSNSSSKRRTSSSSRKKKSSSKSALGASSAALFEGEVSVTADEDTNALVITASLKDYLALKKVIEILDKPRRQVFIEAVIMEVSIKSDRQFGLSVHGGIPGGLSGIGEDGPLIIGSQVAGSSFGIDPSALTGFAAIAQSGTTAEVGGLEIPAMGVLIKAMASSDDVNIMSSPHILTTDNEEAEIVVGSNVPFVTNSAGGASSLASLAGGSSALGGVNPLALGGFLGNNIQRQDVALSLKITPRINAANFVTLEVDQKIEEIESDNPERGPTTSKRQIKSTVVVKDQNTVVIGGLQKTLYSTGRTMVPLLGEIPILGYLFRNTKKRRERRNLLLMLTPHVIEGPEDFKAIFRRKLEEHREFLARFHKDGAELTLGVDFGKKHGIIEAIHQSIEIARADEKVLEELRRQEERPPLPQDLDGVPLDLPRLNAPAPSTEGDGPAKNDAPAQSPEAAK
jgi:general secretion pathway protein D